MDKRRLALELLPAAWRADAERSAWDDAEEIRLRLGRPPSLLCAGKESVFRQDPVREEDLQKILEKATSASMHAAAPSLSEGYVDYRGLRVGVCGAAIAREGRICAFRSISSLAIRITRECRGICDEVVTKLLREGFRNTLIVGPPGAGKTTVLREMIRRFSDSGLRLAVADERNELASLSAEGFAFDLGCCSDVVCGLPKAEAALMLLRGMNPQILAMDEISAARDAEALRRVSGCGVGLLACVHGTDSEELRRLNNCRELLGQGLFTWILTVRQGSEGRVYALERWRA